MRRLEWIVISDTSCAVSDCAASPVQCVLPGDQLPAVFAWPLLLHNDSDGVVQELVARFSELFQKQMRTVKTQALA